MDSIEIMKEYNNWIRSGYDEVIWTPIEYEGWEEDVEFEFKVSRFVTMYKYIDICNTIIYCMYTHSATVEEEKTFSSEFQNEIEKYARELHRKLKLIELQGKF